MTSNRRTTRPNPRKLLGALLATTAMFSAIGADVAAQPYPQEASVRDVVADSSGYGGQLALPIGGSRILRFTRPIGQVMVGNPKVGDVIPLGERTLYVLGKAPGATNLTVMPRGPGAPLATLDLRIGYDVDSMNRAMRQVLPNDNVEVTAHGDGVVLTGVVGSSVSVARAASIAEQYAPGHVVNLTSIRGAEQVMLSVRVAEVQRTALQQLGLNKLDALWDTTGALTLAPPVANPDAIVNLLGRDMSGDWTVQSLFDALERKGYASTLAEPNLVALSGETAVFFAGGEFPIPVPQSGAGLTNTITIEYKQYGVSIGFTPTVFGDTINLAVAPEVSALDPANSVVIQGFRVPGLTTRRAKTTIELRNGQSFAIAGLIRKEFSDNIQGIPGVSRVPIFGALARSTGYQNNETEVVIIVTAHMVRPTSKQNLLAPTDVRQAPSELDLYLNGTLDRPIKPAPTANLSAPRPQAQPGAAASGTLASATTAVAPPAAMLAVNALTPPVQPTIATPATTSAAPALAVAPPPAQRASPAIPAAPATRPIAAAPQASVTPAPAAKPAPTLAMAAPAVQPAARPIPVAPTHHWATVAQANARPAPAAKSAPTLAMAPSAWPADRPIPVAMAARPVAAKPLSPSQPQPALATNAPALKPAPAPAAKPLAAPTAGALAAETVAAVQQAPSAKLLLATITPTPQLDLTPTSTAAATSAAGR